MKTEINEKTLELNVISSLLKSARKDFPKAYSVGFSLWRERTHGLDSSIDASRTFRFLSFQFKKPYKVEGNTYWFRFNNNKRKDQHNLLCGARITGASNIYYALPLFENLDRLYQESPNFLKRTYVADPLFIGALPDYEIHKLKVTLGSSDVEVHSDFSKTIKVKTLDKILKEFLKKKEDITNKQFIEKLEKFKNYDGIFKKIGMPRKEKFPYKSKTMLKGIAIESKPEKKKSQTQIL